MHTITTFVAAFAEFSEVDTALIQTKLDEAALDIDQTVWEARSTKGHGYLTAHLLAMSPEGNAAKLVAKDGSTTYEMHYRRLLRMVTAGLRST